MFQLQQLKRTVKRDEKLMMIPRTYIQQLINMKTLVSVFTGMASAFMPESQQGNITVENEWQRGETKDTVKKEG
jgi:hypothetical protein